MVEIKKVNSSKNKYMVLDVENMQMFVSDSDNCLDYYNLITNKGVSKIDVSSLRGTLFQFETLEQ